MSHCHIQQALQPKKVHRPFLYPAQRLAQNKPVKTETLLYLENYDYGNTLSIALKFTENKSAVTYSK